MSKDLVIKDNSGLVEYNPDQMEVITKYIAPGCNKLELSFLVEKSKLLGMNVLKNECYFVPQNTWDTQKNGYVTKWSVQTSVDFYRKRGINTGLIDWYDSRPYCINKEGKILEWHNIPSKFPKYPDMAIAKIQRKDMSQPIEVTAYWKEYVKTKKDGSIMKMWDTMPGQMLSKVAEAAAWRRAVPDLAGVYISDEMSDLAATDNKEIPISNKIENNQQKRIKAEDPVSKAKEELKNSATPEEAAEHYKKINEMFIETPEGGLTEEQKNELHRQFRLTMGKLQKSIAEKAQEDMPKEPEKEEQDNIMEEAVSESKDMLDKNLKPKINNSILKVISKILYTLEDENKQPFMKTPEEINDFICFLFQEKSISSILLSEASKFVAKFNNGKNIRTLLDIYIKFKNKVL